MALEKLYLDLSQPSGLAGEQQLYRTAKGLDARITLKKVRAFLKEKESYTLHRVTRKRFPRRQIIVQGPGIIASIDLADMSKLSKFNKGFKYMLVVIDSFSRYLNVALLKKKNAETVLLALKRILAAKEFNRISRIQADKGSEFINKKMLKYLEEKGITLYNVSSYEIKASIAERVIQTIKRKIYKYLTEYNTQKYESVLPFIIKGYNHTHHRTLNSTPSKIHALKEAWEIKKQFHYMYKRSVPQSLSNSSLLSVGDSVRLAYKAHVFRRGFQIQNTLEIFKIRKIDEKQFPSVYYLRDLGDEDVAGIFYREELIPTTIPEYFPADILRKKKIKGKLMYFVQWRGYPSKFNSWISARDLKP